METDIMELKKKELLKKGISFALRIVVSAIILSVIISLVQWQNVLTAYSTADSKFIFYAGILLSLNLGVRIFKWRIMLKSVKENPSISEAYGSVMLGISLGSFTPGEIGDYAGRALHITDARRSYLVGLALLDKAQIFVVTSAAGIMSLALLSIEHPILLSFILIGIGIVLFGFLFRMNIFANIGHHVNKSFFQRRWLTNILDGFSLLKQPQVLATSLFTIAFHGIIVLQMYFLLNAFSPISFVHVFIGTSAMMFVKSLLPISLADIGIREAGSIFFFSKYAIAQAVALNASLLLFMINIFIPSVLGTYFIRHQHISTSPVIHYFRKSGKSQ